MHETKVLDVKTALSKNMIELRRKQKMSQAKLAEAIGKSVQTINTIESGKTWPDHSTIQAIAKALEVDETDLFNDPGIVAALNFYQNKK
jgi:transcriptional regulator with XRE-family HTH domain